MGCVYTTAFRRFNSSKNRTENDVAVPVQIVARHEATRRLERVERVLDFLQTIVDGRQRSSANNPSAQDNHGPFSRRTRSSHGPWPCLFGIPNHAPGVVAESMHVCVPCLSISSTTLAGE